MYKSKGNVWRLLVVLVGAFLLSTCGTRSVDTPEIDVGIDGVEPQAAQVKSIITIRGAHFIDPWSQTFVCFDGEEALPEDFISITDSEIVIRVPNEGRTGDLTVRVQNETSNAVPFTVFGPWMYVVHETSPATLSVLDSHVASDAEAMDTRAVMDLGFSSSPGDLAVTPEGDKAYVTFPDENAVVVLDAPNNTVASVIQTGLGPRPSALAITEQDKHRCFIANEGDRSVSVLDTLTDTVVATIEPDTQTEESREDWGPSSLALDPDFETLYVAFRDEPLLRAYWVDTLELRSENATGPKPIRLLVLPDNGKVYSLNQGNNESEDDPRGSLTVVRVRDQLLLTTITLGEDPTDLAPVESTFVIITNRGSNSVTVLQADGEVIYKTFTEGVGEGPVAVAVRDDASRIYVASGGNGMVYAIDRDTLEVDKEIPLSPGLSDIWFRHTGEGDRLFVLNTTDATVTAVNVEEEDGTPVDEVIATTAVGDHPLFMRVEDLTTYPPDEETTGQ